MPGPRAYLRRCPLPSDVSPETERDPRDPWARSPGSARSNGLVPEMRGKRLDGDVRCGARMLRRHPVDRTEEARMRVVRIFRNAVIGLVVTACSSSDTEGGGG